MSTGDPPQNSPQAFGEELRRLRESAGFSLEDVMSETKVSRRILEALERGSFQFLPERVFSRNFVQQYATTIGADARRLAELFDSAWERFLLTSGSHPVLLVDEAPPRPPFRWRFWLPIAIGVAFVVIALLTIILAARAPSDVDGSGRSSSLLTPTARHQTAAAPSPVGSTVVAPNTPSPLPDEEGPEVAFRILVDPDGECWMHYRDREGRTDQRLLTGGSDLALELAGPVLLTVGNASSATLVVGGRSYHDLGEAGQVVHLEVGPEGVRRVGGGEIAGG